MAEQIAPHMFAEILLSVRYIITISEQDYVFVEIYRKGLCCYACENGTYPKTLRIVTRVSCVEIGNGNNLLF